jgi:hypothetical protein
MGLQTFLGPILAGTQKNTNPVAVTSATPSASYLSATGTGQSYRNTGVSNYYQFVNISQSTLTSIAAASFPSTFIPYYTVNGVNYPICVPAGSYIDNIDLNITTAPTFSGSPTSLAVNVQLIGAPGSTYATAQTVAAATLTTASLPGIGSYAMANSGSTASASSPLVATSSATPLAMLLNTGPTDSLLQLNLAFTGGTTPAITAGAFGFAISYVVRSPDGSWYPVSPPNPLTTPTPNTY